VDAVVGGGDVIDVVDDFAAVFRVDSVKFVNGDVGERLA
jgi:hypothetical protein